jgi:hypothetical protein
MIIIVNKQYTVTGNNNNNNNNNNKSNTEYYLLLISKMTLLKKTTCFGLYFLRPLSGRKYPFTRKLYNAYSVVSVSLNRHDYKRDLVL